MRLLKAIFGWLTNRWVMAALGLFLLAVLIWFAGPLIAIGGWEPLESAVARLAVILVVVVLWAAKAIWDILHAQRSNTRIVEALASQAEAPEAVPSASEEEAEVLRERFQEALAVLRKARLGKGGRWRRLYQLPWYLIIGPPGAGKTTALKNSGLRFPLLETFGQDPIRGIGGTRNCDWWFTDEAVLLDTAGRYTTQDSDELADRSAWDAFLQLLKKHRRRRPIDGVLVAISLTDLVSESAEVQQQHALAIRSRLQELHEQLNVKVPVYVLFTKCDLISGFVEFFDDLDREERAQVWGFTYPLADSRTPGAVVESFDGQYQRLLERLESWLPRRLDEERDLHRRGMIQRFALQMAALKGPLSEFFGEAFHPSRYEDPHLVRGVYLSSGTQEGTPIDRVLGSLSATFGLSGQAMPAFSGHGRSYFLTRMLRDVVFREADLVTDPSFWTRHRSLIDRGVYAGSAVVLAALVVAWVTSHTRNTAYIERVAGHVADYNELIATTSYGTSPLLDMLVPLDALRAFPGGYDERDKPVPLSMAFGLYQGHKLGEAASAAYRRALNTAMLPRLLERLGIRIRQNADRPEIHYMALKAYLMLGDPRRLDPRFVEPWITLDWERRLPGPANEEPRERLHDHLDALLEGDILPTPLDGRLVAETREVLAAHPLSERIYARVGRESAFAGLPEWRATDKVRDAIRYFSRPSGKLLSKGVPGLYTADGYRKAFMEAAPTLIASAANETWVMGPEYEQGTAVGDLQTLTGSVLDLYLDDYIRVWRDYLDDVDLVAFRDFADAAEITRVLSGEKSPIKQFIAAVVEEVRLARPIAGAEALTEGAAGLAGMKDKLAAILGTTAGPESTALIEDPANKVNRAFEELIRVAESAEGAPPPLDRTLAVINKLYIHLSALRDSGARGQPGGTAEAISEELRLEAQRLPPPLSRWMRSLARNSAQVSVASVRDRIDAVWRAEIAPFCRQALDKRYPLTRDSFEDANLRDFGRYFGPQGLVDDFIATSLRPYIDRSARPWREVAAGGVELGLSPGALQQLEGATRIKEAFFSGGGQMPMIRFALKPVKLDNGARQVRFELGDQRVTYRHGPTRLHDMQWPPSGGSLQARLVITPVDGGRPATLSAEGPWGLYRLLDQGELSRISADRFSIAFDTGGMIASFELKAASVANPFRLPALEDFRCLGRL